MNGRAINGTRSLHISKSKSESTKRNGYKLFESLCGKEIFNSDSFVVDEVLGEKMCARCLRLVSLRKA